MKDIIEQLREWDAEIKALPPSPSRIVASHSVPFGKTHRQWMTNGDLVIWVNRGEIADIALVRAPRDPFAKGGFTGIPVVYA